MAPGRITWQEKVRALLDTRNMSVRQLAGRMGRGERTVRTWISGTHDPLRENAVVAQMAVALNVPEDWLLDGREGPPPRNPVPADVQALARAVPARFRKLAFALADDAVAEYLLAQLEIYERVHSRGRPARG